MGFESVKTVDAVNFTEPGQELIGFYTRKQSNVGENNSDVFSLFCYLLVEITRKWWHVSMYIPPNLLLNSTFRSLDNIQILAGYYDAVESNGHRNTINTVRRLHHAAQFDVHGGNCHSLNDDGILTDQQGQWCS